MSWGRAPHRGSSLFKGSEGKGQGEYVEGKSGQVDVRGREVHGKALVCPLEEVGEGSEQSDMLEESIARPFWGTG